MTLLRIVRRFTTTLVIGEPFTGGLPMKSIFVAAALVVAMTSPAFAKHCPRDVKIIDQSMSKATGLNAMQMAEVKALRDKGAALHKSVIHGESIKDLHAAV